MPTELVAGEDLKVGDIVLLTTQPREVVDIDPSPNDEYLLVTIYADDYKRFTQAYYVARQQTVERVAA